MELKDSIDKNDIFFESEPEIAASYLLDKRFNYILDPEKFLKNKRDIDRVREANKVIIEYLDILRENKLITGWE